MKESKSMEVGRLQRVVQYRVVQKMTWLAVEPLPSQSANHNFVNFGLTNLKNKEKCSSVVGNRWLLSNELFIAVEGPKPDTIFKKVL